MYVSLGGRIVLLNSVLNSIPIFYLSFMKLPAVVLKKIIRIQREFLWGGVRGGRKINWVSWKEVCKPRGQGGLGVKDVGKVNLSLHIKWRWRLLQKENALWKDLLVARYGPDARLKVHWIGSNVANRSLSWWKDLCGIDVRDGSSWFANNIKRQIGNGNSTRFWYDCWTGTSPLCDRFPRLYMTSMQKESMVSDVWVVMEGVGRWEWRWRRRPFVWEEALLTNLLEELPLLEISEEDDYWRWNREDDGRFSVRSAYLLVDEIFSPEVTIGAQELRVFKNIWKSPALSKVIAFRGNYCGIAY
jgi:hypothetical protein